MPQYQVGSLIEYQTFTGSHRRVRVTAKVPEIKNGRDGFDGVMDDGKEVWGYDHQITRVLDYSPYPAEKV